MIFIALFICIILLILCAVLKNILFENGDELDVLLVFFSILSIFFFIITFSVVIYTGYMAKVSFLSRNKIILMQEKSIKKIEYVDSSEVASSTHFIFEGKEIEILQEKLQLQKEIIRHNGLCNFLIFGLFAVDEKKFGIEY